MPPVVAGAAVTAGGALAGGILNSRANNKAMQSQERANAEAIAMAKDNEKRRREEYDRAEALSKAQWDAEQARLEPLRNAQNGLLGQASGRLGLNIGQIGSRPYQSLSGASANSGVTQPRTLAQLAGSGYVPPGLPEIQAAPKLTIADIANWGSPRRMA